MSLIRKIISSYIGKGIDRNQIPCPFHDEQNGSFHIYDGTNTFYCFSCQKGGGPIQFIMAYENVDYKTAQLKLNGIEPMLKNVKQEIIPKPKENINLKIDILTKLYLFLPDAYKIKGSNDYLSKRGLKKEIGDKFGIKYIDSKSMSKFAKNFSEKDLNEAGLLTSKGNLMFYYPAVVYRSFNDNDEIIGLQARHLYIDKNYKTVKTKGTFNPITYINGDFLYLVEGFFDGVSVSHSKNVGFISFNGIPSEKKLQETINKYPDKTLVIAFDNDQAGNLKGQIYSLKYDICRDVPKNKDWNEDLIKRRNDVR